MKFLLLLQAMLATPDVPVVDLSCHGEEWRIDNPCISSQIDYFWAMNFVVPGFYRPDRPVEVDGWVLTGLHWPSYEDREDAGRCSPEYLEVWVPQGVGADTRLTETHGRLRMDAYWFSAREVSFELQHSLAGQIRFESTESLPHTASMADGFVGTLVFREQTFENVQFVLGER